ncbi:MAG: hypothetical protein GW875_14765 [Deltaproteobacteria bacterium]|nr:hypothetical protein [Deltaproteobacteria bacterium]NCP02454.1 hypothetical protein [Deltaproteobacteria bacterium]
MRQVIYRFLDSGILHNGFARVRCGDCGHEYLLAFSYKRRHFCPSCHPKRVVEFGQWVCEEVLRALPHRHFTFSIPKMLRRYFLYDRKLLSDLSACGWESLKAFFRAVLPEEGAARPGPSLPFRRLVIFWDSTPTFTFCVRMVASMETERSRFHPLLTRNPWKRSFGTRSSKCFFPRARLFRRWLTY